MHYYQHNIGDYRRDTSHLSLLEHGVYRTLLDLYYLNETPIPRETEWVIRRLSAKTNDEILAIQAVLKDFFVQGADGYRHKRCDVEISEYTAKANTAKHNGKLGGRPKKTQSVIFDNPDITEGKANHKPLTNNHKPITTALPLPDFINPEILEMFKSHRGAKFSTNAKNLTIKDLTKAQAEGNDPNEMLEKSIANGWKGVFTPKSKAFKPADPDYMRGVT